MSRKQIQLILISVLLLAFILASQYMGDYPAKVAQTNTMNNDAVTEPQAGPLPTDDNNYSLKMTVFMGPAEYSILQKLKIEFEAKFPGTTIELENIPEAEMYQKLQDKAQVGESPDVMMLKNKWLKEFAGEGYLSSRADEFISNDLQSQMNEQMMAQVKWNGYLWGVPKQLDAYILAWNPQRLAEKGWDHPPRNPQELAAMNRQLTDSETGQIGVYLDPDDPYAFISLIRALGGNWLKAKDDETLTIPDNMAVMLETLLYDPAPDDQAAGKQTSQNNIGNPEPSESHELKKVSETDVKDQVDQTEFRFVRRSSKDVWKQLQQGQIALMIVRISDYLHHSHFNIAASAMPPQEVDEQKIGAWMDGVSFAVSANSESTERAFQWIQRLSASEAQLQLSNAGGGLPGNMETYPLSDLSQQPNYYEFIQSIEQGKAFPLNPDAEQKLNILPDKIEKLFNGTYTIKQFTESLRQSWGS